MEMLLTCSCLFQATLDEQTLRERYLAPWKAIADEGLLRGVMCSQSAVNHVPMHAHKRLITGWCIEHALLAWLCLQCKRKRPYSQLLQYVLSGVLRGELGLTNGFVHSDGGCVISCNMGTYHVCETRIASRTIAYNVACGRVL